MKKQRSESRRTRLAKVGILWATHDGEVHRDTAFMEDVNRSGVGLRVRFAFPIGFPLLVELQDQICEATVRHCDRDGVEYFVGIEFDGPVEGLHLGPARDFGLHQTTT